MTTSDAAAFFDRTARRFSANYGAAAAFEERLAVWRRAIDDVLPTLPTGAPCLDLGCGDGTLSLLAADRGIPTVGFDRSTAMLDLARRKAGTQGLADRVDFVRAALPLIDNVEQECRGAAGLVLCSSVIEYIDDPAALLRQIARLLRPGGTLLLSLPNVDSIYRICERLVARLAPRRDSYVHYQRHRLRVNDIVDVLQQEGVRVVHEQRFALPAQRWTEPVVGPHRGRWLATMILLRARREGNV